MAQYTGTGHKWTMAALKAHKKVALKDSGEGRPSRWVDLWAVYLVIILCRSGLRWDSWAVVNPWSGCGRKSARRSNKEVLSRALWMNTRGSRVDILCNMLMSTNKIHDEEALNHQVDKITPFVINLNNLLASLEEAQEHRDGMACGKDKGYEWAQQMNPTHQSWSSYCGSDCPNCQWQRPVLCWYGNIYSLRRTKDHLVSMRLRWIPLILEGPASHLHRDTYAGIPREKSQSLSQHHYLSINGMPNSQAWIPLNTVFIQEPYFKAKQVTDWAQPKDPMGQIPHTV